MKIVNLLMVVCGASLFLTGCGVNPFGQGQPSLSLFARIGKAMQKPSAIHDEENSKTNQQATVTAASMAKRLAKGGATLGVSAVMEQGIKKNVDNSYTYWEIVQNKPSEEDDDKKVTGKGEITFTYSGGSISLLSEIDETKITGIKSFSFIGYDSLVWNGRKDSVEISVTFSDPSLSNLTPGITVVRGKNISTSLDVGRGDTAFFTLNELDLATSVQSGRGSFFDAHTGADNTGESYSFNFGVKVDHKKTYGNYLDNEGEITFSIPWRGGETDSLHFEVKFYAAGTYKRTGVITDGEGRVRVEFTHFDKPGKGVDVTRYYDKDGKLLGDR